MNDQTRQCPKCQASMMELKGGLSCCPACGFEGEPKKADNTGQNRGGHLPFWLALLTPSFLSLLIFVMGLGSKKSADLQVTIGIGALVSGVFTSIYCGAWLARHFFASPDSRVLLGLIFIVGIGFVNFMIICAGCAANPGLH